MDKKELKDIILKTLEKEGGAAGIKALAKAAKTSKDKLKKDLSKMGGVKQHKHGDYISTPIKEVKEIIEVMIDEKKKKKKDRCHKKADSVYGSKTSAYKSGAIVKCRKGMIWKKKKKTNEDSLYELKNIIRQALEEKKKGKCKPSKGKRFAKRVNGKCRSFGQAGKAKKGGDRIRPGTKKAHAYCARSAKIKKCKNPPCANTLSRKKWKCQGSRSVTEATWTD